MSRYAESTDVSSERSRGEIERTLRRYGADAFVYGWEPSRAVVQFRAHGRHVKFELPMPQASEFTHTPDRGMRRTAAQADKAYEQAVRQRWRALVLVIKAKLESVETGITTFEQEFLSHTLLPNGQTVGEWALPQVADSYSTGRMPELLPPARREISKGS